MTIRDALKKIIRGWWIIAAFVAIFTFYTLSIAAKPSFIANISLGMNFNDPQFNPTQSEPQNQVWTRDQSYSELIPRFSKYLEGKFKSVAVQEKIASKIGRRLYSGIDKKPFYTVNLQDLGFIDLNYETADKAEAEKFLQAAKEVYKEEIIPEWNNQRLTEYEVKANDRFIESVASINPPREEILLPVMAGLLIGLFISLIVPNFKKQSE